MTRVLAPLATLALCCVAPSPATAQERPPEECGMTEEAARYGPLEPGSVVTLQRHRFVGDDDNWDDRMSRWVGRSARVTRLAGVDAAGCPGVRVDVDGGQWFWRVRDLGIGTGPQPPAPRPAPTTLSTPQRCDPSEAHPTYGPISVGTEVVLGRHRRVGGDDNWTAEMGQYVGRRARVVELAGADGSGCAGVRVDIDGGQWFWRIRDLRIRGAGSTGTTSRSTGLETDHGRPAAVAGWDGGAEQSGLFGPGGLTPPQECGMTDATANWGPVAVGSSVVLGQHREVNGDANWSDAMQGFVGRQARVTELVGVDDVGCPVVRVDVDGGQWFWRIRDLTVVPRAP